MGDSDLDEYEGGVFTQEDPVRIVQREQHKIKKKERRDPAKIGISPDGIPFFISTSGERIGCKKKKKRKRRQYSEKVAG